MGAICQFDEIPRPGNRSGYYNCGKQQGPYPDGFGDPVLSVPAPIDSCHPSVDGSAPAISFTPVHASTRRPSVKLHCSTDSNMMIFDISHVWRYPHCLMDCVRLTRAAEFCGVQEKKSTEHYNRYNRSA